MPPPPGPGPVAAVHRITIMVALFGAMAYVVWAIANQRPLGVLGGIAATAAIGLYLRNLRGRLDRKLTPREPAP